MSILASELRVGNTYNRKHGKGWTETTIDENIIVSIFHPEGNYSLQDFEPIELKSSVLKNYGFIYKKIKGISSLKNDIYEADPEGDTRYWDLRVPSPNKQVEGLSTFTLVKFGDDDITWSSQRLRVKLNYLHQLQLLYFSLTGQELEYKPE